MSKTAFPFADQIRQMDRGLAPKVTGWFVHSFTTPPTIVGTPPQGGGEKINFLGWYGVMSHLSAP